MIRSYFSSIIMEHSIRRIVTIVFIAIFLATFCSLSLAAVGCTLNDPDRDVKRIFPESTGYKTSFITIEEIGGEPLKEKIQEELGEKFDPIYESIDTPYAYYDILKGKKLIGRIHGVNQKGKYGGMQLILATDLKGNIIEFYYQKISSPEARKFRDISFTRKFTGLSLKDFYKKKINIKDPSKENNEDFLFTLRGIKKNLILLEKFKLDKKGGTK